MWRAQRALALEHWGLPSSLPIPPEPDLSEPEGWPGFQGADAAPRRLPAEDGVQVAYGACDLGCPTLPARKGAALETHTGAVHRASCPHKAGTGHTIRGCWTGRMTHSHPSPVLIYTPLLAPRPVSVGWGWPHCPTEPAARSIQATDSTAGLDPAPAALLSGCEASPATDRLTASGSSLQNGVPVPPREGQNLAWNDAAPRVRELCRAQPYCETRPTTVPRGRLTTAALSPSSTPFPFAFWILSGGL